MFIQLARGLRALHRAGKLHRDLKPSNVLVAHGRVVVLDFGLVREVGDAAITVTQEEAIVGTPAYMAPEQISNGALRPACDWYAFGVMLYEALSGVLPFGGPLYKLLQLKLEQDAQPIRGLVPQLPEELVQLCDALLSRDPMQRSRSEPIAARIAAIVHCARARLAAARVHPPSPRLSCCRTRNRWPRSCSSRCCSVACT